MDKDRRNELIAERAIESAHRYYDKYHEIWTMPLDRWKRLHELYRVKKSIFYLEMSANALQIYHNLRQDILVRVAERLDKLLDGGRSRVFLKMAKADLKDIQRSVA